MRKLTILILLAALALPAFSEKHETAERITVAQLEQAIAAAHGSPDAQVAQQLSGLGLSERLSAARLARLEADLPGPQAQHALTVLADVAEFLNLPAADTPSTPPPSHAQQTALMALTREFVVKTLTKLPNFFATRETTRFEGTPAQSMASSGSVAKYGQLHEVGNSSVAVLYRDNQEWMDQGKTRKASLKELRTMGEFGPILATLLNDVAKGTVLWSHWEQGEPGPLAVFHYAVPEQASHYRVASVGAMRETQRDPAYHGEIAINPADGSILRLTMVAELKPDNPMTDASLLVDYGPVEFGGVTYICPVRSLALSLVRVVVEQVDDRGPRVMPERSSLGPPQAYLNVVQFTQYHLFRADTRILAGDSQEPAAAPAGIVPK